MNDPKAGDCVRLTHDLPEEDSASVLNNLGGFPVVAANDDSAIMRTEVDDVEYWLAYSEVEVISHDG